MHLTFEDAYDIWRRDVSCMIVLIRFTTDVRTQVLLLLGKSTGNPRVATAQPVPLPAIYPYPSQGYGFACGLAVKDL